MSNVFVIAEAGVNHDGDVNGARKLVQAAAEVGADAVKFQTFSAEKLVIATTAKAEYQIGHSPGETQFEMLRHLELSRDSHYELQRLATQLEIEFISTPFDLESLGFLANEIRVKRIKISSGDLTNLPLLHSAGRSGLPLVLSTGMATMGEVGVGLGAVAHGRAVRAGRVASAPSTQAFENLLSADDSSQYLSGVTLLQCTSEYPAPDHEVNLLAMQSLADRFALPVGLSDHSLGSHLSVAAVALGASVVEKHLTLDTKAHGPDHRASLDVAAFSEMVGAIRSVERAFGSGVKSPSQREIENAKLVRRGLYATRNLSPDDVITESDIAILRPENRVPPTQYWAVVGSRVTKPIAQGETLEP